MKCPVGQLMLWMAVSIHFTTGIFINNMLCDASIHVAMSYQETGLHSCSVGVL